MANSDNYPFVNFSSDHSEFNRAYPPVSYGGADEFCVADTNCRDGLQCLTDRNTGSQVCRAPVTSHVCERSASDTRCHRVLDNGYKAMCPEEACIPLAPALPPRTNQLKCREAEYYDHLPSGNGFCLYIDNHTGVPEMVEPKCCEPSMNHAYDFEPEIVKFALSPQYYGIYR